MVKFNKKDKIVETELDILKNGSKIDKYENYSIINDTYLIFFDWVKQEYVLQDLKGNNFEIYPDYNQKESNIYSRSPFEPQKTCYFETLYDVHSALVQYENHLDIYNKFKNIDLKNNTLFYLEELNLIHVIQKLTVFNPKLECIGHYHFNIATILPVEIEYVDIISGELKKRNTTNWNVKLINNSDTNKLEGLKNLMDLKKEEYFLKDKFKKELKISELKISELKKKLDLSWLNY